MTKIPDLATLLNSDNINNTIIDIDTFICELCHYGDSIEKLTEQQKTFYFNQNLEREVNNGGFNQYFCNSSGDNVHETVLWLKNIGANNAAQLLQKAIDKFPGKIVPKNQGERIKIVEEIEDAADEIWNELDEKFFEYEDDLTDLNIECVKKNKVFF